MECAKKQLTHIKNKSFEELPTVKRLLEKIKEEDGVYTLQGITLKGFVMARETTEKLKFGRSTRRKYFSVW